MNMESEGKTPREIPENLMPIVNALNTVGKTFIQSGQTLENIEIHVERALAKLEINDKKYADLIRDYYLRGKSRKQIADELGITRERVREKIDTAVRKLRPLFDQERTTSSNS